MELRLLALFLAACSGAVGPATPEDTLTDTDLLADTVEAEDTVPSVGVVLNEVLASNQGAAFDADGDADDMIELYNDSDSAVDLEGWALEVGGDRFELPEFTTIAAYGFVVVWCDGDDEGLHASFKLTADGDEVTLTDKDDEERDKIGWGSEGDLDKPEDDTSWARTPDGTGDWEPAAPTVGGPNL